MLSELCAVDVTRLVEWVSSIPFAEWPQQHRVHPDRIRPAMVSDCSWRGFGAQTNELVDELMRNGLYRLGSKTNCRMLSVVMPGDVIEPHSDNPGPQWRVRVHVPLATNDEAVFVVDGVSYCMEVGRAYLVNVRMRHEVRNGGATPRTHFMFDVVS